jgi:hypothetical protein
MTPQMSVNSCPRVASFSPRIHPTKRRLLSEMQHDMHDTTEMTSFDSSLPLPPLISSLEYEDQPFDSATGRRSGLKRPTTASREERSSHRMNHLQQSSLQTSSPDSLCLLPIPLTAASCSVSPHVLCSEGVNQGNPCNAGISSANTLPHRHGHRSHPSIIEHYVSTSSSSCKSPHHHSMHSSSSLHRIPHRSLDTQESVGSLHQYHHHLSEEVDSCEEDTVRDVAATTATINASGERTTPAASKRRIDVRTVSSGRLDPSSTSSLHR